MTNINPEPSYTRATVQNQFDIKRILIILAIVATLWTLFRIVYTYAFPEKSPLQLCQESYMESVNTIARENEKTAQKCAEDFGSDIYKLNKCTSSPLPTPNNNCWVTLNGTGAKSPVPPKESTEEYLNRKHWQVCDKQPLSPLCKNKELFVKLYWITEKRIPWKNWFPIMLGIINAESSLWTKFHPDKCWYTNNWWELKWKKTDWGESVRDQSIPDKNGCWLYRYDTIEDFWISKTNTFRHWYKWCINSSTPLSCISMCYVKGDCKTIKHWWVKNASIFLD